MEDKKKKQKKQRRHSSDAEIFARIVTKPQTQQDTRPIEVAKTQPIGTKRPKSTFDFQIEIISTTEDIGILP